MYAKLQFGIFFINRCVGFLLIMRFGITNQCPESNTTVNYVNSCPQSAEKWAEAAKRLNCHSISTNCTNFVYHCAMDHYRTRMIEVCAPKQLIHGFLCVEYNEFGRVIQRNINAKCKACPKMYNSTDVFQYSECFKIKTKMNTTPYMTATLSKRSDSTVRTNSGESLHINTTTDTTSYSRYSVNNGNENGHTDPPNANAYHRTYPNSFSNQDWSSFIKHVGLGTIFFIIVFVVTMVIGSLLQWKKRNPRQLV